MRGCMKPSSWASTESVEMLESLRDRGLLSERKARLFAAAACRRVWHLLADERLQKAVVVAERYADGLATAEELLLAQHAAYGVEEVLGPAFDAVSSLTDTERFDAQSVAVYAANAVEFSFDYPDCTDALLAEDAAQADLLGDIFFNPVRVKFTVPNYLSWISWLRNIFFKPLPPPPTIDAAWLTGTVNQLALAAYEERELPSGHLDGLRLAVLADALEEAGCTDAELLGHLRSGQVHVRGCWLVDALLGRQ